MTDDISIKTPEEIEYMRHAGKVLKGVLDMLANAVKPGISTYRLDQMAEEFIRSHKGCLPAFKEYRGYPAALCTSVNEEVVHGIPDKRHLLQEGDIIGLDCGVIYNGFYSDACRTFLIGKVAPEVHHFVKTVKRALDQSCKAVREGAHVGDISAAIQKIIEEQGYSPVVECTGHGIGRELHEAPEILNVGQRGTGAKLYAGMTIAIEPIANMGDFKVETLPDRWTIVTVDGTPSAHFEHTVLVTKKGYEILA